MLPVRSIGILKIKNKMATKKPKTPVKSSKAKYVEPGTKAYWAMTPDQRNANTMLNIKESIAGPKKEAPKKSDSKKPVTVVSAKGKTVYDPKARTITTYNKKGKTVEDKKSGSTTNYSSKGATIKYEYAPGFSIVKNKKGQTTTNSDKSGNIKNKKGKTGFNPDGTIIYTRDSRGKIRYDKKGNAIVSSDNTSIEQKAKDVISGKYGSGEARKKALGSDYAKVQAEVNKRMAANKPKTSAPKTAAKTEVTKMEIKRPTKIEYSGPKELQGVTSKPAVDVDKSIDSAMEAIGKSKIMKKGGMVKYKKVGTIKKSKK